jgi:hypothetical protein
MRARGNVPARIHAQMDWNDALAMAQTSVFLSSRGDLPAAGVGECFKWVSTEEEEVQPAR